MESVLSYDVSHGYPFGSVMTLEWFSRPYRLYRIEVSLETGECTCVRLNPARQIPTLLLEDGRALSESLAVLQHLAVRNLCRKLGYSQGSAEFDELSFALALLYTECRSAWGALFYLEDADTTTVARTLVRAARVYNRIDKLLSDRKWLTGGGPSVIDAYFVGTARWGRELGCFDLQHDFPRLHQHLEELEQDLAVHFAHAIEGRLSTQGRGEPRGEVTLAEVTSRLLA